MEEEHDVGAGGVEISGVGKPDGLTGLCAPQHGAPAAGVHRDGQDGIDNAFGRTILPLILGVDPRFDGEIAGEIAAGGTTLLVDLDGLGAGADYTGMTARLYTGAPLGRAPAYDGSDAWPVRSDSLRDPGDVGSALLAVTDIRRARATASPSGSGSPPRARHAGAIAEPPPAPPAVTCALGD